MQNLEAAQSGDRRKALEVLRDSLAFQLDSTESQVHAQLAAQYRATLAELDELSSDDEGTTADDIAGRIALRLADPISYEDPKRRARSAAR